MYSSRIGTSGRPESVRGGAPVRKRGVKGTRFTASGKLPGCPVLWIRRPQVHLAQQRPLRQLDGAEYGGGDVFWLEDAVPPGVEGVQQCGVHRAGADGDHADAPGANLQHERAAEAEDGVLGGGIAGAVLYAVLSGQAGHVDDGAGAALDHPGEDLSGHEVET